MMKKKTLFGLSLLIVALLAYLIYAGDIDKVKAVSPASGSNVSGTLSNFSVQLTTHNYTTNINITHVYLAWTLVNSSEIHPQYTGANSSIMANITITNSSCGLANCANISYFNTSLDTTTLPDGIYNVSIVFYQGNATDPITSDHSLGAQLNATFWNTVTVDNTKPTVSSLSLFNNTNAGQDLRTNENQIFNATVNDATSGIPFTGGVVFQFDNGTGLNFNVTAKNVSGNWNVTRNISGFCGLRCGTQTLTIHANDSSGNKNFTQTITFNPNVPANVTVGADTSNGGNNVGGNSFGNYSVTLGGNYSAKNSTVRFNVSVDNVSGRQLPTYVVFLFDNASGNNFNLSGVVDAVNSVTLWNVSYNVSALEAGSNTVTIYANDSLGNVNNTQTITFTVDKSAPSVTVTCTSSPAIGATVTCSCTASEATTDIVTGPYFVGTTSASESTTAVSGSASSSECYAVDRVGNRGSGTGSWTTAAASSGGGGSGGSSGGVSSGVTGSFSQETWTSINTGETATLEVKNGEVGITEVNFKVDEMVYGAWVKVAKKDSLPAQVDTFEGKTYKILEITKGVALKDDLLSEITLKFKVLKSWLTENGLGKNQVTIYHFVDNEWTELTMTAGEDDGTYIHYTAETPGFSYFVIGEKGFGVAAPPAAVAEAPEAPAAPEAVAEAPAEEAPAAAPEEAIEAPGAVWPWVVVVLVLVAIGAAWYFLKKKK